MRRTTPYRVALVALWLLGDAVAVEAQQRSIRFDRLTLSDGLSQGAVNCILQDRAGLMWFGTQDGLHRFDGYRFTVLRHDPEDPSSIAGNWIWSCVEDRQGRIWVGTTKAGLSRWEPAARSFTRFRLDSSNPTTLGNDTVRVVYEDREQRIWVGTDGGLNLYQPETDSFQRFNHNPSNPASLSHDAVRAVFQDSGGTLWVGTDGGGLSRFDPATHTFFHFRHDPADPKSLSEDRVRAVYEDRDGWLWVGTYEGGLNRLDRSSGEFTRFLHDPADPASLGHNRVRWILQDQSGVLWVGTDGGLNEWLPERQGFAHFRHVASDPASLADDRVMCLYQDRGGVLWVGTRGGIHKWNPTTGAFLGYRSDPLDPNSLSSNRVHAFAEGPDGVLWIGTHEGLNRLDRTSGQIRHYRQSSAPGGLRDERIMSLLVDDRGEVWVGTYQQGLHRLDVETGRFTRYVHDPEDPASLGGNGVTSIYQDGEGVLWVGAYGGGLNRYDRKSDSFVRYRHDPQNPNSLSSDRVVAILEDSIGTLWVGTDGGGLNGFDRANGTFHHIRTEARQRFGLPSEVVWALHEDRQGTLWLGTQDGGMASWSLKNRQAHRVFMKLYSSRDGLANNVVYGILEDRAGRVWVSTNQGISRVDPRSGEIRNYDETHGLLTREFNHGARFQSSTGEMLFGSDKGFNIFRPETIAGNPHQPPLVMSSFRILNKEVDPGVPLAQLREIELTRRDAVVSFEFAALDYTAPEKNQYAYKLEGFDDDWVEQGNERRVTYTNLDPGRYVLKVRGSNNDGLWSSEELAVRIRVLPPPWRTWWAYGLYGLALLAATVGYGRAQARKLEREAEYSRKLEKEVQARTGELEERNRLLEKLNDKLERASYTDSLTGLLNRRYLAGNIQRDIALVDRFHAEMSRGEDRSAARSDYLFLFFDLDGFKPVNDSYGHAGGDQILIQVRQLLEASCRKSDTLIRWGGDEFLVVGRYTDRRSAEHLAERLRNAVRDHPFELEDGRTIRLSCSIGFSFYPFVPNKPGMLNWEQVLTIADRALYIAKKSGRDAWVGLETTETTAQLSAAELMERVDGETERLLSEGLLALRTSIHDDQRLVWAWG